MSVYYAETKATVESIEKIPMGFCNSRSIHATVRTSKGELISVPWSKVPCVMTGDQTFSSKAPNYFDLAWHFINQGDTVILVHGSDPNCNYFYKDTIG